MAKKSTFSVETIKDLPWLSIAIFLAIGWFILTKLGNSATLLGDWISKITNPSTAAAQQHSEDTFTSTHPTGSATWTPQKIQADARSLSISMGTYKGSNFFNRLIIVWDDAVVFNIIKNYTNVPLRKNLEQAYNSLYTDGRDLIVDLNNLYSGTFLHTNQVYLKSKGII